MFLLREKQNSLTVSALKSSDVIHLSILLKVDTNHYKTGKKKKSLF